MIGLRLAWLVPVTLSALLYSQAGRPPAESSSLHPDGAEPPPATLGEALRVASLVIRGSAVAIRSADLQQAAIEGPPIVIIQNAVTVRVAETFKRDPSIPAVATVEVIFPGGLRKGTWIETAPWVAQPDVGDEVLLFLKPHRTISTAYVPMWIGNGVFIVHGDKVVTRGKSDLSLLLQKLPREEVLQRVRGGRLWPQ